MKLQLRPYGPLIPVLGEGPLAVEAPVHTAGELLDWLHGQYPDLAPWRRRIACGMGASLLGADAALTDQAEIALIPPVSGG